VIYRDSISWWRRWRRERLTEDPPPIVGLDGTDDVPPRVMFATALARLTVKQRAVLVLRYFDDLSEARTAEILGISVGTVKSQTSVALRRLRQLAPELGELANAGRED
jgi:DNA-directed RNA polymerase specialized sigma24 family protein